MRKDDRCSHEKLYRHLRRGGHHHGRDLHEGSRLTTLGAMLDAHVDVVPVRRVRRRGSISSSSTRTSTLHVSALASFTVAWPIFQNSHLILWCWQPRMLKSGPYSLHERHLILWASEFYSFGHWRCGTKGGHGGGWARAVGAGGGRGRCMGTSVQGVGCIRHEQCGNIPKLYNSLALYLSRPCPLHEVS